MTKEEKAKLKEAIERKIKSTENAIADYKDMTQAVAPDDAIGRLSRMDAINNKSVMEAALRQAEEKLRLLSTALNKVDDSDFGKCVRCHQEIPLKRLLLMPEVSKCVKCS